VRFLFSRSKAKYGNSDQQKDLTEDSDPRKLPEIVQSLTSVISVNLEEFWEGSWLQQEVLLSFEVAFIGKIRHCIADCIVSTFQCL